MKNMIKIFEDYDEEIDFKLAEFLANIGRYYFDKYNKLELVLV